MPGVQLYDVASDMSEQNNLQAQHPEKVRELRALLDKYIEQGRSTAGPPQSNDVEPNLDKPIVDQDALRKKMIQNILKKK